MSVAHALGSQKPLGRHSLALLIGLQLLLAFLSHDIASVPRIALSNVPSVEMPTPVADGRHP